MLRQKITIDEARGLRDSFAAFLTKHNISYHYGHENDGVWRDSDTLLRVEFVCGQTISALFSPLCINCAVETCGLSNDGDDICRWNSLEELQAHIECLLKDIKK
jgi:hypothetical protein